MSPPTVNAAEHDPRKLLKKYRVFLDFNERQAPGHEEWFRDIVTLGKYNVENYSSPVTVESRRRPWAQTETMLQRARSISDKARQSLKAARNEIGWRLNLEPDILSRFQVEVVCPECRARLWRAELEVSVTAANDSMSDLEERQLRRKNCNCPKRRLGKDRLDNGLNPLFDDRAEEQIEYEEEIETVLKTVKGKRPGVCPDRVIGLRATQRIKRILDENEDPEGQCVGELVRITPFKEASEDEPLLFPFLVLEAKSEKSSDTFSNIYLQTGFAIRALLNLQRSLFMSTPENTQSGTQPLVWFFANKGADWRVYGAYIEETESTGVNYRILELWTGNITYEDSALVLLLIVDYIFDWARDVYRKEIISSLLSLIPNATPTLLDVEIEISTGPSESIGMYHLLKFFGTTEYAIRDARHMHRTLYALYITKDNIGKLLTSAKNTSEAKQFSRRLWRSISRSETWSVTAASLSAIEEVWTRHNREHEVFESPDQPFLTAFLVRSYFTPGEDMRHRTYQHERPGQWNQVHELLYVAVAEDALDTLRTHADFGPRSFRLNLKSCPRVPTDWLRRLFGGHRLAPIRDSFTAAICQSSYSYNSKKGPAIINVSFPTHEPSQYRGRTLLLEPYLQRSSGSRITDIFELPKLVYKRFKVGMTEPNEPFLRVSQDTGIHEPEQNLISSDRGPEESIWDLSNSNIVILTGISPSTSPWVSDRWQRRHCIFMLEPPSPTSVTELDSKRVTVYPQALVTSLGVHNYFSRKPYQIKSIAADFEKSKNILDHLLLQYHLLLSLDSNVELADVHIWIQEKYQALTSWDKARWPYSLSETIEGVKTIGQAANLGSYLHKLFLRFREAIDNYEANNAAQQTSGAAGVSQGWQPNFAPFASASSNTFAGTNCWGSRPVPEMSSDDLAHMIPPKGKDQQARINLGTKEGKRVLAEMFEERRSAKRRRR